MDSVPCRQAGDGGGRTVEVYRYDVFGRTAIYDLSGQTAFYDDWVDLRLRPASVVGNPYFFTGRRLDVETGLYYYRARMYNPAIGRFLQTDPIGYADGGVTLYAGPIAGGAAGAAVKNGADRTLDVMSGKRDSWGVAGFGVDVAVGGVAGYVGGKIPRPKIQGVTSGRNSWIAVGKSTHTKLDNQTIRNISTSTAGKVAFWQATDQLPSGLLSGAFDGTQRIIVDGYNSISGSSIGYTGNWK